MKATPLNSSNSVVCPVCRHGYHVCCIGAHLAGVDQLIPENSGFCPICNSKIFWAEMLRTRKVQASTDDDGSDAGIDDVGLIVDTNEMESEEDFLAKQNVSGIVTPKKMKKNVFA